MLSWIKEKLFNKYAASVARHIVGAVGGFLAAKQLPPELVDNTIALLNDWVNWSLPLLVATGWSFWQKKGS